MNNTSDHFQSQSKKDLSVNKKFIAHLKKKSPANLDSLVHQLHDDVFSEINCLDCARCCTHLGPRIIHKDIESLSKELKIKPSVFTTQYLRMDEDGDYVFKNMPCPFLSSDNYCKVYDNRPKACREYPHTDRRKFVQLLDITLANSTHCPAVYEILKRLRSSKLGL